MSLSTHGQVDQYLASYANDPGSALSEGKNFFLLFLFFVFFFFNLTTLMRVFSQINSCQQKKKQTNKTKKGAPLLGLAKSIY